jgi:hypothetical protein
MKDSLYYKQAELMLKTIPHLAAEPCFALKGHATNHERLTRLTVTGGSVRIKIEQMRSSAAQYTPPKSAVSSAAPKNYSSCL